MTSLLIDLGGTNIKYATYDGKNVSNKSSIPTDATKGYQHVLNKIFSIIEQFKDINLVAISQAGIIAKDSSVFYANSGLPGFIGKSLKKEIESKYGIKTFSINDAKAAATYIAKTQNVEQALVIVLGTGVGSAVIHDNNVHMSKNGITGEIGNMVVNGVKIDSLLSLTMLSNECKTIDQNFNFSDQSTFAKVSHLLSDYFDDLSQWIFNLIMAFGYTKVILGGSLPKFGSWAIEQLYSRLQSQPKEIIEKIELSFAAEGENANLIGAYYASQERLRNE